METPSSVLNHFGLDRESLPPVLIPLKYFELYGNVEESISSSRCRLTLKGSSCVAMVCPLSYHSTACLRCNAACEAFRHHVRCVAGCEGLVSLQQVIICWHSIIDNSSLPSAICSHQISVQGERRIHPNKPDLLRPL